MHPDAVIAIAASKTAEALTQGDLRRRDRLAAVAAARLRARPDAGDASRASTRRPSGVVLGEPRPLHLGRRRRRPATRPRSRIINQAIAWLERNAPPSRRSAANGACAAPDAERARGRGAADAGDPRPDRRTTERKVGHFDDAPAVLEFVNSGRAGRSWRRSAPPAPTISCAPRSGRWCSTSTRRPIEATLAGLTALAAYRADYAGLLRALQARRQPGDARPQSGGLSGARRRHDHLRPRQGDGAHRRRVLRQRDQRDARRVGGRRPIVGLPEQEAFDIEYWLLEEAKLQRMPKPKSLAGPRRASSPAAPAASARRSRARLLAEGACVVLADIDAEALDATAARRSPGASARTRCAASTWTSPTRTP